MAPPIATPPRYHWYANATGAGAHVPVCAVSVEPTRALPLIVGTGLAVSVSNGTVPVAAEVRAVVVYRRLVPVTRTLNA